MKKPTVYAAAAITALTLTAGIAAVSVTSHDTAPQTVVQAEPTATETDPFPFVIVGEDRYTITLAPKPPKREVSPELADEYAAAWDEVTK